MLNKHVSGKIAKMLKTHFDKPCVFCFDEDDERPMPFDCGNTLHRNSIHPYYSAPTIADVIDWFQETRGIWISVTKEIEGFTYIIVDKNGFGEYHSKFNSPSNVYEAAIKSPSEAYEAAFEHILKKLI